MSVELAMPLQRASPNSEPLKFFDQKFLFGLNSVDRVIQPKSLKFFDQKFLFGLNSVDRVIQPKS